MRIIARSTLKAFYEQEQYTDSKQGLLSWFAEAKIAEWKNPAEIKELYRGASILKDNRVVFNICGNKYRLVVKINYEWSVVYIRFVGTHEQYDNVDAGKI